MRGTSASGNVVVSHSCTWGTTSRSTNARIDSRSCSCSSLKMKWRGDACTLRPDNMSEHDIISMVSLEVSDGVARLRLDRPDRHNAIDPAVVAALARAVERGTLDPSVRAVLIGAAGPSFTVGGDLAHFSAHGDDLASELDAMIRIFHRCLTQLGDLRVPVVCAAQGAAAGGGLGLLWCADVVLAADDLKIATGFDRLGLSGDGGRSWALPRLVGPRRACQLLLGGRTLDAAEALEWGLVDRVVSVD